MLEKEMSIQIRLSDKNKALTFNFRKYEVSTHSSGFECYSEVKDDGTREFDRMYFCKQVNIERTSWLNIDVTSFCFRDKKSFAEVWQRELEILYKVFSEHTEEIANICGKFYVNSIHLGVFEKLDQQPTICEQHEEFLNKYTNWYVIKSDNGLNQTTRHLEDQLELKHIYHCHYGSEDGELYLFLRTITVSTFLLAIQRMNYLAKLETKVQEHLQLQSDLFFKNTKIEIPI